MPVREHSSASSRTAASAADSPGSIPPPGSTAYSRPSRRRAITSSLVSRTTTATARGRRVPERLPGGHFLPGFSPVAPVESAAMKASWGTSTRPTIFIRFLPSFCFSSSLRLRVMSPP